MALSPFKQRGHVIAYSRLRPDQDETPIGTAITERGARVVYWRWEQNTFAEGRRWFPTKMAQDLKGRWFLAEGKRA